MPYQPPAVTTPGETPVLVAGTRRLLPPFLTGGGPAESPDEPFPLDAFIIPADTTRMPQGVAWPEPVQAETVPVVPADDTAQPDIIEPEPRPESEPVDVAAIAAALLGAVADAAVALRAMAEPDVSLADGPGRWSRKQLLGHLIDSAGNNHQRFVRAQRLERFSFPAYEQEAWVEVQHYGEADWGELVELWRLFNRHLARVIAHLPADSLDVSCTIGSAEPVTLGFIAEDYVRHLKHHLRQLGVA